MLTPDDIATIEAAEPLRRSVAMLSPGQPPLRREDALVVLGPEPELDYH